MDPKETGRSGVLPEGEEIRRAIPWLTQRAIDEPATPTWALIEQAAVRFNLSPLQAEFLRTSWERPPRPPPAGG